MELARRGVPVRVAAFRREGFFLSSVEAACGRVHVVDIHRMLAAETWSQVAALRNFIRDERFDVVHTWDADAAVFGSLAARWAGVPLITSRRDLGEIYPRYKLWLMHRADVQAKAVVANAQAIADRLVQQGIPAGRIAQLTNIVDVDEFDRLAAEPLSASLPPGRLVGMVARLDAEKDGATFVRAAARVAAGRPEVGFVVAGDGPERARLEGLAGELGIRSRIAFLGDVTYVPALLRRLSVGVLVPKANEGLSNTILEYMAAGLPVVATDCGGNRELVEENRAGLVVSAGDDGAVAQALERMLDDTALSQTMGRNGRAQVAARHRPEVVSQQYLDLYERIVH